MTQLETDYLVIGCGAVAMSFVDTLLDESDAQVIIVDDHHAPGGHWNDAYPFVRLHQPSHFYGVSLTPLGSKQIDAAGSNAGYYELASGNEVQPISNRSCGSDFYPLDAPDTSPCANMMAQANFTTTFLTSSTR